MMASLPWVGLAIGTGLAIIISRLGQRLAGFAKVCFIAGIAYIPVGLLIGGSAGGHDQRVGKMFVVIGCCQVVLAFFPPHWPARRVVVAMRIVLLVMPWLMACGPF